MNLNEKIEKKLNILLGVVIAVLACACVFMGSQLVQGKDASLFGFRVYHIITGSMEPTIKTGSSILVKSVNTDSLEPGDIISFVSRDSAIYGNINTHRIIQISFDESGRKCFITKGDANRDIDTIYVYPEDIKGKVVFHMNILGATSFLSFLRTVPGFITVILLPLLLVCFFIMKSFRNSVKEMAAENDKLEALKKQQAELQEKPAEPMQSQTETDAENKAEN